jgi:adenylosuccinate lyase
MGVGQLCGGVGSLSALGARGLEVQRAFCAKIGLRPPATSWTASRDVIVEWAQVLVLATGTADRIGHEVYSLQRDEIGEVSEGACGDQIGSITMPHKRNPEISEHLGTLSRVVRANAAVLAESLPHDHERDGRSWKVEWHAVPEVTMAAGRALDLLASLLEHLEVDEQRMRRNLEATEGSICSEAIMLALAKKVGKQTAHQMLHRIAQRAAESGKSFRQTIAVDAGVSARLSPEEIGDLLDSSRQTGQCQLLVDRVLADET